MPDERASVTHKFIVAGHEGYLTVSVFPDGTPGEIFVRMSKLGSFVSGLMDAFATSTSIMLQYGVPLEVLINKFATVGRMQYAPTVSFQHSGREFRNVLLVIGRD